MRHLDSQDAGALDCSLNSDGFSASSFTRSHYYCGLLSYPNWCAFDPFCSGTGCGRTECLLIEVRSCTSELDADAGLMKFLRG